jgi:hypothetical protein
MITDDQVETLTRIAAFFDRCRFGYEGFEGYRKSTDLFKFLGCIRELEAAGRIDSQSTIFADLGCADGRVNILMSYLVKLSIGIEIDPEILAEFHPRRAELCSRLEQAKLTLPPENIALFQGSSLAAETYSKIHAQLGVGFADIDLFYTYITLHDLFAEQIAAEAKPGALYLVYGFNRVLPRYEKLETLAPNLGSQGIAALYRKE